MATELNKKINTETSGNQSDSGPVEMDRNEGQTLNGTVGGTGSDLDKAAERLGANKKEDSDGLENEK